MKRLTWSRLKVCILVFLAAVLIGCSREGCVPEPRERIELEFWHTHNDVETPTLEILVKRFEERYPFVKVKLVHVDYFQTYNLYVDAARRGEAPDILRAEITWIRNLVDAGYLTPIDDKLNIGDRSDFFQGPLHYCQYEGRLWGIPQVTDCLVLMYNRRLVPEPPTTFTELVEVARSLTDPDSGRYGFCYKTDDSYWFLPFLWGYGGEMYDKNNQVAIHRQESVNALQFMIDLRDRYRVIPPEAGKTLVVDANNLVEGFKSGEYAMIFNGPWETSNVLTGSEFKTKANLGVTRIPDGPHGTGSPTGGHNYVISATTKHKSAAYDLIHYLSLPAQQKEFALRNNLLPTRHSTYLDDDIKANRILMGCFEQLKTAKNRPLVRIDSLTVEYQAALRGDRSPEEALQRAAQNLRAQID